MPSPELAPALPPVRALLADSHALFRDGLRALLEVSAVEVPAVAATAPEAIERALRWRPQIALIDLHLEPIGGMETTRLLAANLPELPILILTTDRLDPEVAAALRGGACGYLFKGEHPDVLLRAIVACARGTPILSPELARFLLRELGAAGNAERGDGLTLTPGESSLLTGLAARPGGEPMATPWGRELLAKLHRRHRGGGGSGPRSPLE